MQEIVLGEKKSTTLFLFWVSSAGYLKHFRDLYSLPQIVFCSFKYYINQRKKSVSTVIFFCSIVIFMKNKCFGLKKRLLQKYLIGYHNCKRFRKFLSINCNTAFGFENVFKFLFCFRGTKMEMLPNRTWVCSPAAQQSQSTDTRL